MSTERSLGSGASRSVFVFVLLGALLLVLGTLGIAYQQGWFRDTFTLSAEAASAERIKPGMSVRLSGIAIGKVSQVTLTESAHIRIQLQLGEKYHRYLHTDTRARMAREGLFGDSYVALQSVNQPGHGALALISEGSDIPFEEGGDMAEMVAEIRNQVFPVFEQLKLLGEKLNDDNGHFQGTMKESRAMLRDVRQSLALLDQTLKNASHLSAEEIPHTLTVLNSTLQSYSTLAERTDTRLDAISNQVNELAKTYNNTGEEVGKTVVELQTLLRDTKAQMHETTVNLNKLLKNSNTSIDNLQTHWPFTPSSKAPPAAPVSASSTASDPQNESK